MSTSSASEQKSIPILLLKSPSPTPANDPYTIHLTTPSSSSSSTSNYKPHFIPVLTHTILPDALIRLLLAHLDRPNSIPFQYGALIVTSQRAVAAFSSALNAPLIQKQKAKLSKLRVRLFTVGPATANGMKGVRDKLLPACEIFGGESAGSGEVLAKLMLGTGDTGHGDAVYRERSEDERTMKPVLFLTGETRRDIIPKMLMDPGLGVGRMQVDEMVVYQTSELDEFEFHFSRIINQTQPKGVEGVRWVVVFSPTAGKGMLRGLGWLDDRTGKSRKDIGERRTYVACIGPTTREYLSKEFGFEADVVAERPSPQGIKDGTEKFMKEKGL